MVFGVKKKMNRREGGGVERERMWNADIYIE